MGYACAKCGWKDKPSHERYYRSRGLSQPNCIDCNPSAAQKRQKRYVDFVVGLFSKTYLGYVPLASIPYLPLVMLLTVAIALIVPAKLNIILSLLAWIGGYITVGYSAVNAGKRIKIRLDKGQSVAKVIFGYYFPLIVVVIVCAALWWVKFYALF